MPLFPYPLLFNILIVVVDFTWWKKVVRDDFFFFFFNEKYNDTTLTLKICRYSIASRVFNKIFYSQFEDILISRCIYCIKEMGRDVRIYAKSSSYSISPAEKKAKKEKSGDKIYICRSVTFLDHGNRNVTVRSEEKERDFFSEEAIGRVSWNRVNQRKRGTDRNRIGRCFRGSCRGEIKRAKADVGRSSDERGGPDSGCSCRLL